MHYWLMSVLMLYFTVGCGLTLFLILDAVLEDSGRTAPCFPEEPAELAKMLMSLTLTVLLWVTAWPYCLWQARRHPFD